MNCTRDGGRRVTVLTMVRRVRGGHSERGPLIGLSVHELVDDLCKTAVGLWAGGEILGIVAMSRY